MEVVGDWYFKICFVFFLKLEILFMWMIGKIFIVFWGKNLFISWIMCKCEKW